MFRWLEGISKFFIARIKQTDLLFRRALRITQKKQPNPIVLRRIESQPARTLPLNTQIEPSSPSYMRTYHKEAFALNTSSNIRKYDPTLSRRKVTKVLSIDYKGFVLELRTTKLLVVIESQGKEKTGWYKYEEAQKWKDTKEALEVFRPTWR